MIAAWMLAATLLSALLGAAAFAAERALRTVGRQARGPWIVALVAAAGWPALAPALASQFEKLTRAAHAPAANAHSTLATIAPAARLAPRGWAAWADVALIALWAAASAVLLLRLAWSMRTLSIVRRSADRGVIDGVPVLVTPSIGPAVFGARRTSVVVPRWLFELDAPLRSLVVRHEQEHCRARDPQLTLVVAVTLALVPWNAGVWWIAKRLRLVMELDCDARVLKDAAHPERYARLLLFIAQRQSLVRLAPMLAESNSHLSWRIAAMNAPRTRNVRIRAVAFATVAIAALSYSTRFAGVLTAAPVVSLPDLRPPSRSRAPVAGAATQPFAPRDSDRSVMAVPGSVAPRYPQILQTAGVEGGVLVAFVVDRTGDVDAGSIKVLRSTHKLFTEAVAAALPKMHFLPAILHDAAVRQAVRMPILFSVAGSPSANAAGRQASLEKLLADAPLATFVTLQAIYVTAGAP